MIRFTVSALVFGIVIVSCSASPQNVAPDAGQAVANPNATNDGGGTVPDRTGSDQGKSPCGTFGQPCCPDGTCTSKSVACRGGTCGQERSGETGKPCSKNGDCQSGVCLPVGDGGKVCTASCTSASDCIQGWSCDPLLGHASNACKCTASRETCNGKDDDCNGIVDDEPGVATACVTDLGAGAACVNGGCGCAQGSRVCAGRCTETAADPQNCGGCAGAGGHVCVSTQRCENGSCACPSSAPVLCQGSCINTKNDASHCGTCGHACRNTTICVVGNCQCPPGRTLCAAGCLDTSTDPKNCGACGSVCPNGSNCVAGACHCPANQTLCASGCVNTSRDTQHCGACGAVCPNGTQCDGSQPGKAFCYTATGQCSPAGGTCTEGGGLIAAMCCGGEPHAACNNDDEGGCKRGPGGPCASDAQCEFHSCKAGVCQ